MLKITFDCVNDNMQFNEFTIIRAKDTKVIDLFEEKKKLEAKGYHIKGLDLQEF